MFFIPCFSGFWLFSGWKAAALWKDGIVTNKKPPPQCANVNVPLQSCVPLRHGHPKK